MLVLGIGIAVALSGGKKEEPVAEARHQEREVEKEAEKAEKKSDESKSEKTEAKSEEGKTEAEPAATAPSASAADKKPPTEEEKKRFAEAQKKEQEKKEAEKPGEKKPELPVPTDGPQFNKGAAIAALSSAASASTSCKRPGGPTGSGKVIVTFAPSGRVTSANVAGGAFGGTPVGGCVASVFRRAKVPPFGGGLRDGFEELFDQTVAAPFQGASGPQGSACVVRPSFLDNMRVLIELDRATYRHLEKVAPAKSRSRSAFIRAAIQRALWEIEEENTRQAYLATPDTEPASFDADVWEALRHGGFDPPARKQTPKATRGRTPARKSARARARSR